MTWSQSDCDDELLSFAFYCWKYVVRHEATTLHGMTYLSL